MSSGQPEERAAEQVKGIGTDEIGAEVGRPAPAPVPASDRVVAHLVEWDLLHVEIAVEQKITVVEDDKGYEEYEGDPQTGDERQPQVVTVFSAPQVLIPYHPATSFA